VTHEKRTIAIDLLPIKVLDKVIFYLFIYCFSDFGILVKTSKLGHDMTQINQ